MTLPLNDVTYPGAKNTKYGERDAAEEEWLLDMPGPWRAGGVRSTGGNKVWNERMEEVWVERNEVRNVEGGEERNEKAGEVSNELRNEEGTENGKRSGKYSIDWSRSVLDYLQARDLRHSRKQKLANKVRSSKKFENMITKNLNRALELNDAGNTGRSMAFPYGNSAWKNRKYNRDLARKVIRKNGNKNLPRDALAIFGDKTSFHNRFVKGLKNVAERVTSSKANLIKGHPQLWRSDV